MKVFSFFKLLNRKIKKYEKYTSNPFCQTRESVTIVWVENPENDSKKDASL